MKKWIRVKMETSMEGKANKAVRNLAYNKMKAVVVMQQMTALSEVRSYSIVDELTQFGLSSDEKIDILAKVLKRVLAAR